MPQHRDTLEMDCILQTCIENVLNFFADQNRDFDNPLNSRPSSPDERRRFYQRRRAEEHLTNVLRLVYENEMWARLQPVAGRTINPQTDPLDVAQDSDDSDIDVDDSLEEDRGHRGSLQRLNIAASLERDQKRNKVLKDMFRALQHKLNATLQL